MNSVLESTEAVSLELNREIDDYAAAPNQNFH